MTGRACHAIELHPAYVDVTVARWQNFTRQTGTLEATGEAFESKSVSAIGIPPSE
jgi:DNA modification methylase